jgi:phosphomannomutase
MRPDADTLASHLGYAPVPLRFGTSGRRGRVVDLPQIEVYITARAELAYLLDLPPSAGGIAAGAPFYFAYDLRPSSTRFVAEQGDRGEIAQAVVQAIRDSGLIPVNLGPIPTPALSAYALQRGAGSIMVTGSHIPFDRNGYKTNTAQGELLKEHEGPIQERMEAVRRRLEAEPFARSPFDAQGMLRQGSQPLPPVDPAGAAAYVERYVAFFGADALRGLRLLVYQHSAVGRDLLPAILVGLGAEVCAAGRSETFVPIDTENLGPEQLATIQALADAAEAEAGPLDAVLSTDGDSDRPLVCALEPGSRRIRFLPGDLLGMLVAEALEADAVVVPVSCNDAIDRGPLRAALEPRTRIGSPHVIAGMARARARGKRRVVGWEANGGFLLGSDLVREERRLAALPTRDAVLPMVALLRRAVEAGASLTQLRAQLPARFGAAGLVPRFPRETARRIVARLSPADAGIVAVEFGTTGVRVQRADPEAPAPAAPAETTELAALRTRLEEIFPPGEGFTRIARINYLDGVRVTFEAGEVAHLRPSGNADEFRLYAVADTPERAQAIVAAGAAEPDGTLRRLEQAEAVAAFRTRPGLVRLHGAVQHYAWGGTQFLPALLGAPTPASTPWAELWFGAHPSAPAAAALGEVRVPLDHLVAAAPRAVLGASASDRAQFPFLLKLLDVRQMLSIQAHPDRDQAAHGFAQEERAGTPPGAGHRAYRDPNPKPELHVALTEFWLLHGFRPAVEIAATLQRVPELQLLAADAAPLSAPESEAPAVRRAWLRALLTAAMTLPQERVDRLLDPLVARLAAHPPADKRDPGYWVLRAARELPLPGGHRDRGLFCLYLLNLVRLAPGEGTFQAPGTLHAYLEGVTVELLGNSDNVLRAGLTPKPVDPEGLLKIVTFEDAPPAILRTGSPAAEETVYADPARALVLGRIQLGRGASCRREAAPGPALLLALDGPVRVSGGAADLPLPPGGCCLVPAGAPCTVTCTGERAVVFQAGPRPGASPAAGPPSGVSA